MKKGPVYRIKQPKKSSLPDTCKKPNVSASNKSPCKDTEESSELQSETKVVVGKNVKSSIEGGRGAHNDGTSSGDDNTTKPDDISFEIKGGKHSGTDDDSSESSSGSEGEDGKIAQGSVDGRTGTHIDETSKDCGGPQRPGSVPSKRKVTDRWLKEKLGTFSWLSVDEDRNVMYCNSCMRHWKAHGDSKPSVFVTGCSSFKSESLEKHATSSAHVRCVEADRTASPSSSSSIPKSILRMNTEMANQLKVLFNITYYLVQKERPLSDFPDLAALHQKKWASYDPAVSE